MNSVRVSSDTIFTFAWDADLLQPAGDVLHGYPLVSSELLRPYSRKTSGLPVSGSRRMPSLPLV